MDNSLRTIQEWEAELGEQCRRIRLSLVPSMDQKSCAEIAGVALSAVKRLESGKGATIKTLIKVLRAIGRADWLETLAPEVSVSPLQMAKRKPARQRAARTSRKNTNGKA